MIDDVTAHASGMNWTKVAPNVASVGVNQIPAWDAVAKAADDVILAICTDLSCGHENHGGTTIKLLDGQQQRIAAAADAAAEPVVAMHLSHIPLDILVVLANKNI